LEQAKATPIPEKKREANTREDFISYLKSFNTYTFLGKVWFRGKSGSKTDISPEKARAKFAEYWSPLLEKLIQSWLRMETLQVLRRTRATHGLMLLFEDKYSSLVRNRGRFLFHDVTRMLGGGTITPELKRDLQYRMYCRYDHWMLDEFQDTSQPQWRVIKPFLDDLAESKAGNEGSIFVVGDIKQSVYQWRGGDPELFRSVSSQLQLEQRGMSTSYRSVQPVLDLVNDICDYARTAPGCEPAALEQWGEYPEHRCAPHLEGLPGASQIWQAPKAENVSANDLVCQAAADILERTGALRRGLKTAILVSTKNQALVIKGWMTDHGIPAEVCDDVPVGVDSPLGKNLLYFFRWLLMPGDPFVVGLLTHSPLRPLITPGCPESMGWKEWRLLLEREGYAAVMEELERRLLRGGTELTDFHRDRLAVWQNEAEQVDEQGVSLDEWIRRMEDLTRREDPAAGIVRIMTIHKSKGLGFDIVILPQIGRDTPFANATHLTHFVKKNRDGEIEGIVIKPPKEIYQEIPQFRKLYGEWRARQQFDGFCKLYVALTRAKRATYVILPYREDNVSSPL
ncbi:UvrD-helicase domain-containing protein, partial [uncultured Akkermansia sp.]|uniref:UvrD-helicase domain-containing protein n=1 Tax=uncultured Akkermansia sp. TaxID=512294 RepID=UPI002605A4FB